MNEIIEKFVILIGAIVIIGAIMAFPVKWLWNWLMPTIFGLTKITVWQALGINIFTGILFRSTNKTIEK